MSASAWGWPEDKNDQISTQKEDSLAVILFFSNLCDECGKTHGPQPWEYVNRHGRSFQNNRLGLLENQGLKTVAYLYFNFLRNIWKIQ